MFKIHHGFKGNSDIRVGEGGQGKNTFFQGGVGDDLVSNTSWIKVLVFILLDKEEDVLQRKKQCLPRQQSLMLLPMFRHHLGGSKANTYSVEESDWKEKEKEKRAKNIILGNAKA